MHIHTHTPLTEDSLLSLYLFSADEATIDTKVDALRQSLLSRLDDMKPREAKR